MVEDLDTKTNIKLYVAMLKDNYTSEMVSKGMGIDVGASLSKLNKEGFIKTVDNSSNKNMYTNNIATLAEIEIAFLDLQEDKVLKTLGKLHPSFILVAIRINLMKNLKKIVSHDQLDAFSSQIKRFTSKFPADSKDACGFPIGTTRKEALEYVFVMMSKITDVLNSININTV